MSSSPILIAEKISKAFNYPKTVSVLKEICLQIHAEETIAIVGRSGEGKSTLLQILGTLENPCEGTLYIEGEKVVQSNRNSIRNKKIGFVFQNFNLLEDYTSLENVLMPARIARRSVAPYSESYLRALYLLEKVGLADRAHFHTKNLSGGEKQRIALARAMCNNPSLILADEPSGNLDSQTAKIIHEMLFLFAREQGKALLLVTHDLNLASLCQRQYELRNGLLINL